MSIVIIRQDGKVALWKKALQEYDPSLEVYSYLEPHDKEKIKVALVWKHPEGSLKDYPNLAYIASNGAGVDFIFEDVSAPTHLPITRVVDEQLAIDMSEYVLAIILHNLKKLDVYKVNQTRKTWQPFPYKRIADVRVGILGLGVLGSQVAKDLENVGFKVQGWSNTRKDLKNIPSYAGKEELSAFLNISDILVCLLPLTKDTKGILNKQLFEQLPKNAFIINVARGGHLVDQDLRDAINNDQISGASLDVYHDEPLPKDHFFWTFDEIMMTPHYASVSDVKSVVPQIVENYKRMQANLPLLHLVSKNRGY
ncbi:MAG: glyoxylate/hydroxypyruvate reductase A [Cellulophaga sp.]|nr:glyoxylate/hydroxypyruvate reductase A [Cellulophaga sp.]